MTLPIRLLVVLAFLVALPAVALAQAAAAPPPDAAGVLDALLAGRWSWLMGVIVIALVEPAKRALIARWPHVFAVDVVGVALAFVVAAVANAGAALVADAAWNRDLVIGILRSAFVAIGGYITIKRLLVERVQALAGVFAPLPKARVLKAPEVTATFAGGFDPDRIVERQP